MPAGEWTYDKKGREADPITLRVKGRLEDLERALARTGWTVADTNTFPHDAAFVLASVREEAQKGALAVVKALNHLPHVHLPTFDPYVPAVQHETVASASYRGQPILEAFEKNNNPLGGRDHFLVYQSGPDELAIAPSKDSGLMFDPHSWKTLFLNHRSLPDTDGERDLVLHDLEKGGDARVVDEQDQAFGDGSVYKEVVPDSKTYDVEMPPAEDEPSTTG